MAKKNRPKKSKALVVWAIVTVIVLLADCVGNYLVVCMTRIWRMPS